VLKGVQDGFLNHVLGVFPVVREMVNNSKELPVVSLYEFIKGSDISTFTGMD
jgi:hypothetical protein